MIVQYIIQVFVGVCVIYLIYIGVREVWRMIKKDKK